MLVNYCLNVRDIFIIDFYVIQYYVMSTNLYDNYNELERILYYMPSYLVKYGNSIYNHKIMCYNKVYFNKGVKHYGI